MRTLYGALPIMKVSPVHASPALKPIGKVEHSVAALCTVCQTPKTAPLD